MLLKNTSQVKNSIPEKVQVGCKSIEIDIMKYLRILVKVINLKNAFILHFKYVMTQKRSNAHFGTVQISIFNLYPKTYFQIKRSYF